MTVTPEDLGRFAEAIEHRLGLRVGDRPMVMTEIIARRAAGHHESTPAYLRRVVDADADELRALVAEVSVGETYFFRHVEQFHAYADLLPGLLATRGKLRVLSAGCSSGEEAYTLAILARERLPDPRAIAIHAIDFNPSALERAARARYTRWALRATPADHERRWFKPEALGGRDVVLASEIRDAVNFAEANLLEDGAAWTVQQWDIILCRNVIMYFGEARSRGVVERLTRALVPGGYLFLGHAETLRDHAHDLELCHTHGTFYYRRTSQARAVPPIARTTPVAIPAEVVPIDDGAWIGDIAAATTRVHEMVDGALARTPPPIAPSLEPIRELVTDERFAEALDGLAQLPATLARSADAMLLRAVVLTQTGDVAAAEATCRELLELDPKSASAHYLLAMCRGDTGDLVGSERHAREALVLDPSFAMARVHLAFLARRTGDRASAITHLERAVRLLEHEDATRLSLFGGGFSRGALVDLCRAELGASGRDPRMTDRPATVPPSCGPRSTASSLNRRRPYARHTSICCGSGSAASPTRSRSRRSPRSTSINASSRCRPPRPNCSA